MIIGRFPQSRLRLQPPELTNPTTIDVTDAMIEAAPLDPSGYPQLNLPAGDVIIRLPGNVALTRALELNGAHKTRHIVMIGGQISPALNYAPATMRRTGSSGDYAVYAVRGFTGGTGGTFRFKTGSASYDPYTADIPRAASAAQIKAALEAAAGAGSVFAVENLGGGTGGPWRIVPANSFRLGRPVLDLSGITGSPAPAAEQNVVWPIGNIALKLKDWTGTAHIEGVMLGGLTSSDAINVQTQNRAARLQLANVRTLGGLHAFHDNWLHVDGMQIFCGPSQLFMENVELASIGGNGFISQPNQVPAPLPMLSWYDYWFRNCHFHAIVDDTPGKFDASTACFRQENSPQKLLGQRWDARQVYISRSRLSDGAEILDDPDSKYFYYREQEREAGIILRERPANPIAPTAGLGYVSPGYLGAPPSTPVMSFARCIPLSWSTIANADPGQIVTGQPQQIWGLVDGRTATVAITAGKWSKNGGAFTAASFTVQNGDTIAPQVTSPGEPGGSAVATATIDRVPVSFTARTLWDPATLIGAGMAAWFDLSDTSTLTIADGVVTAIADKSGNGRTLERSAGGAPLTTIGGRSALAFDGASIYTSAAFAQPAQYLAFAAVRPRNVAADGVNRVIFSAYLFPSATHAIYLRTVGNEPATTAWRDDLSVSNGAKVGIVESGATTAIGALRDNVGVTMIQDGTASARATSTPAGSHMVGLQLGGIAAMGNFAGDVGEVMLIDVTGWAGADVTNLRIRMQDYFSIWVG